MKKLLSLGYKNIAFQSNLSKIVEKQKMIDITRTNPSIFLEQQHLKHKNLTLQQKHLLKLFIPKSPLNIRMSLQKQMQYLPKITSQLYERQKQKLQTKARIMQNINDKLNLQKYLNLVYKDVYSRFLISQGVGVEWNGNYNSLGILNPLNINFFANVYEFFFNSLTKENLFVKKIPSLYSIKNQKEISTDQMKIETIKRVGHHILFPIKSYGKYDEQFKILKQKNGEIYFITFCEDLWKTFESKALCIKPNAQYVILKQENISKYYIISNEFYQKQKDYFKKIFFHKHQKINSVNFAQMEVQNPAGQLIPILFQIESYERKYGSHIYPIIPSHTLSDYDRSLEYGLDCKSKIQKNGDINYNDFTANLNDSELQLKLVNYFKKRHLYFDLCDLFQEDIFISEQGQKLYLIPLQKLFFRLADDKKLKFIEKIKNHANFSQSKVILPTPAKKILKKRLRRQFQKLYSKISQQTTDYSTFQECMNMDQICISQQNDTGLPLPIFQRRGRLIFTQKTKNHILNLVKQNQFTLNEIKKLSEPLSKTKIFYINDRFAKVCSFLIGEKMNTKSIIIQPQSQTEGMLQIALNLAAELQNFDFLLVKLHPNLDKIHEQMDLESLIRGAIKANQERQYGFGYEAFRMWVAFKDNQKGHHKITQLEISNQLSNTQFIRKCYWNIISILKNINQQKIQHFYQRKIEYPFFDKFMLDHIDYYIVNMQNAYKCLDLYLAHQLTIQFFRDYVQQIYINSAKKNIISYYNQQDTKYVVLYRLLDIVGVIAPLMPFSSIHISQNQFLEWPKIQQQFNYQSIDEYNKLVKYRVQLRKKLQINHLKNSKVYIKDLKIDPTQMALFLGVNQVVGEKPNQTVKFSLKDALYKTEVFSYETCYRCDPKNGVKDYLCKKCQQYLQSFKSIQTV